VHDFIYQCDHVLSALDLILYLSFVILMYLVRRERLHGETVSPCASSLCEMVDSSPCMLDSIVTPLLTGCHLN
jgi:hypothetical protein